MAKKIKSIEHLRNALIEQLQDQLDGKLHAKEAKEFNNTAGKIINATKLELEYNVYLGRQVEIEFLENREE